MVGESQKGEQLRKGSEDDEIPVPLEAGEETKEPLPKEEVVEQR